MAKHDVMVIFRKYKLLNLLEFCSARKRMSVIVSNEEGQIFLLCKGADKYVFFFNNSSTDACTFFFFFPFFVNGVLHS